MGSSVLYGGIVGHEKLTYDHWGECKLLSSTRYLLKFFLLGLSELQNIIVNSPSNTAVVYGTLAEEIEGHYIDNEVDIEVDRKKLALLTLKENSTLIAEPNIRKYVPKYIFIFF